MAVSQIVPNIHRFGTRSLKVRLGPFRIAAKLAEALQVSLSEIWKDLESRQADSS